MKKQKKMNSLCKQGNLFWHLIKKWFIFSFVTSFIVSWARAELSSNSHNRNIFGDKTLHTQRVRRTGVDTSAAGRGKWPRCRMHNWRWDQADCCREASVLFAAVIPYNVEMWRGEGEDGTILPAKHISCRYHHHNLNHRDLHPRQTTNLCNISLSVWEGEERRERMLYFWRNMTPDSASSSQLDWCAAPDI